MSNLSKIIRTDAVKEHAETVSYMVTSIIKTARMALENENSGISTDERMHAAANALEVAEALMGVVEGACETAPPAFSKTLASLTDQQIGEVVRLAEKRGLLRDGLRQADYSTAGS